VVKSGFIAILKKQEVYLVYAGLFFLQFFLLFFVLNGNFTKHMLVLVGQEIFGISSNWYWHHFVVTNTVVILLLQCSILWGYHACRKNGDLKNYLCLLIQIILICIFIFFAVTLAHCNISLWFDEIASLNNVKGSLKDIIHAYSIDMYPPMEGILRKLFILFFSDSIFVMKIFSVVPTILMIIFMSIFLSKEFSYKVSIIFLFCMLASGPIMHYSIEIRMYTWALFFISMLIPTSWYIIKTGKTKWWLLFILSTLCAAYTHYYAALSVCIICCSLFLYIMFNDRKQIKKALITNLIVVLLYLPWVYFFVRIFKEAAKGIWIPTITIDSVTQILASPFQSGTIFCTILFSFLFISSICVFLCTIKKDAKSKFAFIGFLCSLCVMAIGVSVSLLTSPLIYDRYLFCTFGMVFFFFAVVMGGLRDIRKYGIVITALFILSVASLSTKYFIEYRENKGAVQWASFVKECRSPEAIIFMEGLNPHIPYVIDYWFPKVSIKHYGYKNLLPSQKELANTWIIVDENEDICCDGNIQLVGTFNPHDWYKFKIYHSNLTPGLTSK
jgi:hypothetical protein